MLDLLDPELKGLLTQIADDLDSSPEQVAKDMIESALLQTMTRG